MLDYERLYRIMFNGITDAIECMEQDYYERAKETLIRAQQAAEEYYMTADEEDGGRSVYILPHDLY